MDQGLIPRRYAKALYKFAFERKQDQVIYGLMKNLAETFDREPSLQAAIYNPYVPASDKVNLITVAAGADKDDCSFRDFLKLLVDNQRIAFVRGIALAYVDLYRKANGIYKVEVVTAATLGTPETNRLRSLIEKHLNGGSMEYTQRVNPELIGGFVINIDNEQLDASISNELKQLRLKLLSN